jgi:hypothetical protein
MFVACPSFQEDIFTLEALRRRLACCVPPSDPVYETSYPYLDRDLLQFVCGIPREQLIRPGHRRSLMRRALANIVPSEILNRTRKGFVTRRLRQTLDIDNGQLSELISSMRIDSFGIVDQAGFAACLRKAGAGFEFPGVRIARTVCLELWLRNVMDLGIVRGRCGVARSVTLSARDISAEQI